MEKDRVRINSHGSFVHIHPNARDRTAVDGSVLLRGRSEAAAVSTATMPQPTPSDFVLQWGNQKRLRCMKVQVRARDVSSAPVYKTTVRADRRVVRAERETVITKNNNQQGSSIHNPNLSNGYLNLRQRPISPPAPPPCAPPPPQRVHRNNSEISGAMRGHNTNGGFRSITSPEKRPPLSNQDNNHHHHQHNKSSGATTISETKKGGSSSGSGEGVAPPQTTAMWPPKFVIALTNKEKEEDFLAIKGCKLPQRPKKRAKIIQRTINLVSPGTWLCDLTLERYEVREKKISKKKPRGLKAIVNNMESDSE